MQDRRSGVTFLELSIVLVIIGLLAGILMAGQVLISRSELRNALIDATAYAEAMQQFKLKYGALPGDFPDAANVWSGTTNGNGNGIINANAAEQALCEHYTVWQQLGLGGFIKGKYTGLSGLALCAPNSVPEKNVPRGSVKATAFSITSLGEFDSTILPPTTSTVYFDGNYNNIIILGGTKANDFNLLPGLRPDDAFETDKKADDGSPALGNIRATKAGAANTPNCTDAAGLYKVQSSNIACTLVFMSGFQNKTAR